MIILLATAALVFTRAIQQQNVTGGHYVAAIITPLFIAASEVAIVLLVVETRWIAIPWMGAGGAIGAVSAMFVHKRIFKRD